MSVLLALLAELFLLIARTSMYPPHSTCCSFYTFPIFSASYIIGFSNGSCFLCFVTLCCLQQLDLSSCCVWILIFIFYLQQLFCSHGRSLVHWAALFIVHYQLLNVDSLCISLLLHYFLPIKINFSKIEPSSEDTSRHHLLSSQTKK